MAVVEKTIDIIGDEAFCGLIISRTIPTGLPVDIYDEAVQTLRSYALRGMSGLESIHMPNVTKCSSYSFYACSSLKTVVMENCTRIEERSFQDCHALETLTMPKLTFIGNCALAGGTSTNLTELNLPELLSLADLGIYSRPGLATFIAPKLQQISGNAFSGNSALKQLDLPSIKYLYGQPFSGMNGLEVINFGPNLATVPSGMLGGTPAGLVVNMPFEEGHFSGAPWGNANAVINYGVEYSGDVPMPTT